MWNLAERQTLRLHWRLPIQHWTMEDIRWSTHMKPNLTRRRCDDQVSGGMQRVMLLKPVVCGSEQVLGSWSNHVRRLGIILCKEKTGFRQTEIAMIKFKRAGLACVLLIASSLAQGPTTFHPGFNFFSRQQDIQLGQESAAQVRRQMQMVKDPFLNDYDNRVGR